MSYPNLEAEMKRLDVSGVEIANEIGVSKSTFYSWLNGTGSAFPISKALAVRDTFFKGQSIDYLFSEEPMVPTT